MKTTMNNKTWLYAVMVLVLVVGVVGQASFPYPVYGKVTNNGVPVGGVDVVLKHLGNSREMVGTTNKQGDYLLDASRLSANDNDLLRVTGCAGSASVCVKKVKVASERVRVDFELSGASVVTRKGGLIAVLAGAAAALGGAGVYFVRKWKGRKPAKK